MKTVTLAIGNSDDKLTQLEWATFIARIKDLLGDVPRLTVYFFGTSPGVECWQNACWVFSCHEDYIDQVKREVTVIRSRYKQDSAAWLQGDTLFL